MIDHIKNIPGSYVVFSQHIDQYFDFRQALTNLCACFRILQVELHDRRRELSMLPNTKKYSYETVGKATSNCFISVSIVNRRKQMYAAWTTSAQINKSQTIVLIT